MANNEISSLLELLRDDDATVRLAVEARLRELGPDGLAALERAAASDDPRLRSRARLLHHKLKSEEVVACLHELLADDRCDLEEACLLLASVEKPQLELDDLRDEFARLAERLSAELEGAKTPRQVAESLGRVLGEEETFSGNAEDYYDPGNSYIDDVLQRRVGIPISLSAVYMIVGRRAGLIMRGVGMPCHFLVQLERGEDAFYVDPFGGGRILARENCRAMLAGFRHSWREDYLRPVSDRDMLRRMMANLIHIYQRDNDEVRLNRLYGFVNALQRRAS